MATRPVLRIFISSTAVDLLDYREKVRDAVLRLEQLPVAMETFSAMPGQPVSECTRMAAEADAVICVVAHRYGYVPPVELGGDGERSITWLEVAAAKHVFAFIVDPAAPWTAQKEQDRLVSEPEKIAEIGKAVQKLKEFKDYLGKGRTLQRFSSPEDLGEKVSAALANFTAAYSPVSTARVWQPLFCHALQPAQHFRGRVARLQELKDWLASPVTPDRVISLVAAGGTGKTALVHQALHEAKLSDRAGVFVWSFYEDPSTDKFLRAAYMYFTGETNAPAGGMLERLQLALSGDMPHILVLDGLERVQSEGDHHRRGDLEDLQLKRLVRALAGGVGAARALVTSRFPMVDLDGFTGAGHRAIQLDDLERPVALEVMRAWNVNGDEAALTKLIEPLDSGGLYHALSVAVLASYLGSFPGRAAPDFSLADAQESDDPKARKLYRILEQYAGALTNVERDLLARMALFPRGLKVEILGWIAQAGGDVSGALIGLSDHQLVSHLERLKKLGLVFRYETERQAVYSAHPFLRTFFRDLLAAKPESVHESVRAKLAPSLEARPSTKPADPAILDQYELLIEESLLAGRVQDAFDLYWDGLGGYENFGWVLGANARGLRILERFVPGDDFSALQNQLPVRDQSKLVNDLGLFAMDTGDLARARRAFRHSAELYRAASDRANESVSAQNLCDPELRAACFPQALDHAEDALTLATEAKQDDYRKYSFAYRATAHHALGNIQASEEDFRRATELEGKPLFSGRGIREAESKALRGDRAGALAQTEANREIAVRHGWNRTVCWCDALLARLLLPDAPDRAAQHLRDARTFAERSGDVALQLRCFQASCELQLHLRDYPQSIAEGEAGILLADTCGFGKYSIDIRIALAETYLASGDSRKALQHARWALDRSEQPDCQYAWGRADGLHFCGLAHLRLGELELARQRLTAALGLRDRLGHGRSVETRRLLALAGEPSGLDRSDALTWLIERTRGNSADVRTAAIRELAEGWRVSDHAMEVLRERLFHDPSATVREAALRGLARGWHNNPGTRLLLIHSATGDESPTLRTAALQELARGWKDAPHVLNTLQSLAATDAAPAVRVRAVRELIDGWPGDASVQENAVGLLAKSAGVPEDDWETGPRMFNVPDLSAGRPAASSIMQQTLSLLEYSLMKDSDDAVAIEAVDLLVTSFPELGRAQQAIGVVATRGSREGARLAAVLAIARDDIGHPAAREFLRHRLLDDDSPAIRRAIGEALSQHLSEWERWLGTADASYEGRPHEVPAVTVQAVRLRDIRMFRDTERLRLNEHMWLLVGDNAAGKSTILRCIAFASIGAEAAGKIDDPGDYLRHGCDRGFIEVAFRLNEASSNEGCFFTVGLEVRRGLQRFLPMQTAELTMGYTNCVTQVDNLRAHTDDDFGFALALGASRAVSERTESEAKEPSTVEDRVGSLFSRPARIMDPRRLNDLLSGRAPDGRVIDPGALRDTLGHILPDFAIVDQGEQSFVQMYDSTFPVRDLSDGYGSLLALVAHIFAHGLLAEIHTGSTTELRGIVMIDEVDLHLHPEWQRRVLPDMRRVFPGLQFICTTHSAMVAGSIETSSIAVLHRNREGSHIESGNESAQGWGADQILTSWLFGLPTSRDLQTEKLLADYAHLLKERGAQDLEVRLKGEAVANALAIDGGGLVDQETYKLLVHVVEEKLKGLDDATREQIAAKAALMIGGDNT